MGSGTGEQMRQEFFHHVYCPVEIHIHDAVDFVIRQIVHLAKLVDNPGYINQTVDVPMKGNDGCGECTDLLDIGDVDDMRADS